MRILLTGLLVLFAAPIFAQPQLRLIPYVRLLTDSPFGPYKAGVPANTAFILGARFEVGPVAAPKDGTVRFSVQFGQVLATVQMANSVAEVMIPGMPEGTYSILAEFSNPTLGVFTSSGFGLKVGAYLTATQLSVPVRAVTFGQPVLAQAVVRNYDYDPTPTGSLGFYLDGVLAGNAPLNGAGNAQYTYQNIPPGSHKLEARYPGGPEFEPSGSSAVTVEVQAHATRTQLTVTPARAAPGQTATLRAAVTVNPPVTPAVVPRGRVSFREGATSLGEAVIDASGVGQISLNGLTAGTHIYISEFRGDPGFLNSTSLNALLQVSKAATACELIVPAPPAAGQLPGTLRARITTAAGGALTVSGVVALSINGASAGELNYPAASDFTIARQPPGLYRYVASYAGNANFEPCVSAPVEFRVVAGLTLTSAANGTALAPASLGSAYGQNLGTAVALEIKDSANASRAASILFASAGQVNFLVPAAVAAGGAEFTLTNSAGERFYGSADLQRVAPALFTVPSASGLIAAAYAVRNTAAGVQLTQQTFTCAAACGAQPVDLGGEGDVTALVLYGTGFRNIPSADAVRVSIGGVAATVLFAGAQPEFAGLDQVNVLVPPELRGRGLVQVQLTAGGVAALPVLVAIQ